MAAWVRILAVQAKHGVQYESPSTQNTTKQNPSNQKTTTRTENPSGADPSSTGAGDPSTRKPVSVEIWGSGRLRFNTEKPDGTLRKLTDPGRLQGLGWRHRVELAEGVRRMYGWYVGE